MLSSGILPVTSFLQADIGSAHFKDSPALLRTTDQGKTHSGSTLQAQACALQGVGCMSL